VKQSSLAAFFKPMRAHTMAVQPSSNIVAAAAASAATSTPSPNVPTVTPYTNDNKRSATRADVSTAPLKRALTTAVAMRSVATKSVEPVVSSAVAAKSSSVNNNNKEEIEGADVAATTDLSRSKVMAVMRVGAIDIQVRLGDIAGEHVDVITNAANGALAHGSGVAGALRRAGGAQFQRDSDEWVAANGTLAEGEVAVTPPGNGTLRCKFVVHAVGPIYRSGRHDESVGLLSAAVRNTLQKTHELNCASVSLPAISSGIFGFPKDLCAKVMFDVAEEFCKQHESTTVRQIRFTNFDRETVDVFLKERARRGDDDDSDDDNDDNDDNDENSDNVNEKE
jgi:O-acetyl-ADP-ribose deacetylase (regulator of RNase III)